MQITPWDRKECIPKYCGFCSQSHDHSVKQRSSKFYDAILACTLFSKRVKKRGVKQTGEALLCWENG
jgi:biotin synthase-like enzyme